MFSFSPKLPKRSANRSIGQIGTRFRFAVAPENIPTRGSPLLAGLVIDVGDMNSITVDRANQTATIGAGCRLGDITERLFKDGLAISAGTCAPVGITGIALGGGHGVSSRKLGLTTDNLLSVRLVDASGAEIRASKTENQDLFWGLQGGG